MGRKQQCTADQKMRIETPRVPRRLDYLEATGSWA